MRCGTEGWGTVDPSLTPRYPTASSVDARIPSLDCLNAIIQDMDVDANAFEARDAWLVPTGRMALLEDSTMLVDRSGLGNVVYAARFLFVYDLGMVGDIEHGPLVRKGFVQHLQRAGGGRRWTFNEALYQVLVDEVDIIVPATAEQESNNNRVIREGGDGAAARWMGNGKMVLHEGAERGGALSLEMMVHEVRHATGPGHTTRHGWSVDLGLDGSFGWGASFLGAAYASLDHSQQLHGYMPEILAAEGRQTLERVEPYRTGPESWEQTWDGFPWLGRELPEDL